MSDWDTVRDEFPALRDRVYLNTAGGGPMCRRALEAVRQYHNEFEHSGDTRWDEWLERVEAIRGRVARIIGASSDEIAFLGNASQCLNAAADMIPAENVVLFTDDFPSVNLPWIQRRRDTRFVESRPDGSIALEDIQSVLEPGSAMCVSFVQYRTGFRMDLEQLSTLCRERGSSLVVDATQGFGVFPIDVGRSPCDALMFSAYKWATAGYGVAPLYVARDLLSTRDLPSVGWRSAEEPYAMKSRELVPTTEARGLELGHPPFASVFALGGALEWLDSIGIDRIEARVQALTQVLHDAIGDAGFEIVSPRGSKSRSSITMVRVEDAAGVAAEMKRHQIFVSARGGALRVSLHYFNHEDDIERFVAQLRNLARRPQNEV